ncbi:hypothetical protein AMTR_s00010p00265160 [Amborella trichopoda]|uniref:Uncharacterized protein n=1 Tax=Amborella trichopoda TaxID=13333 RepID=W1NGB4_AMBTC|nr:hypothetical protein AMTR_s00010p00265160 [Amborella trichopoda]
MTNVLKVRKYNGNSSLYHNRSPSSGLELIDVSDDIDVSFMLGGEFSSIVVYITFVIELEQRSMKFQTVEPIGDCPSARNSQRNAPLPDRHENIQMVPKPELVPERDMEDIEPIESPCR